MYVPNSLIINRGHYDLVFKHPGSRVPYHLVQFLNLLAVVEEDGSVKTMKNRYTGQWQFSSLDEMYEVISPWVQAHLTSVQKDYINE